MVWRLNLRLTGSSSMVWCFRRTVNGIDSWIYMAMPPPCLSRSLQMRERSGMESSSSDSESSNQVSHGQIMSGLEAVASSLR